MSEQQYDNTNQGALFKHDKKGVETRKDYSGQVNVEGKEFWISGWIKKSKAGETYMSLAIDPKEKQEASGSSGSDFNDDVPF